MNMMQHYLRTAGSLKVTQAKSQSICLKLTLTSQLHVPKPGIELRNEPSATAHGCELSGLISKAAPMFSVSGLGSRENLHKRL